MHPISAPGIRRGVLGRVGASSKLARSASINLFAERPSPIPRRGTKRVILTMSWLARHTLGQKFARERAPMHLRNRTPNFLK